MNLTIITTAFSHFDVSFDKKGKREEQEAALYTQQGILKILFLPTPLTETQFRGSRVNKMLCNVFHELYSYFAKKYLAVADYRKN